MSIQEIVFWVLFIVISWISYIAFWIGILAIPVGLLYLVYRIVRRLIKGKK